MSRYNTMKTARVHYLTIDARLPGGYNRVERLVRNGWEICGTTIFDIFRMKKTTVGNKKTLTI